MKKAGFGGGCHWCTEAVFESLIGVEAVAQGWIASDGDAALFSEGVVVTFDPLIIPFEVLIDIHLHTHSSTSFHSFRDKYRSAIYTFSDGDAKLAEAALQKLQPDFDNKLITKVLPYREFKINRTDSLHYYYTNQSRPFCETYINPKLQLLLRRFSKYANADRIIGL